MNLFDKNVKFDSPKSDEEELPTFSFGAVGKTSTLKKRMDEEERFKKTGVEKEKVFVIL